MRLCCSFECRMRLSLHSINFRYGKKNFEKFLSISAQKKSFPCLPLNRLYYIKYFCVFHFFHLFHWFHLVSVHVLVQIKVSMSKTIFHNKLMVKLCDINGTCILNIRVILWANSNKSRIMTNVFIWIFLFIPFIRFPIRYKSNLKYVHIRKKGFVHHQIIWCLYPIITTEFYTGFHTYTGQQTWKGFWRIFFHWYILQRYFSLQFPFFP